MIRWFRTTALTVGLAAAALLSATVLGQDEPLTRLTQFAEFGEPDYPPDFPHFDYVNPEAPKGGAVTLAAFGSFERLDTIVVGGDWAAGIGLISDSLMTGSGDELDAYYPLLAESVDIPPDLSYAIFNINPVARWHDGTPITAGDFVFAFDLIKEHGRPLLKQFWAHVVDATALDDHRLRFDFDTVNNWKTLALAAGMGPLPRHYYEANGIDPTQSSLEPTLYNGAYTIESVDPGRTITYRRFEDYWARDLPVNVGQNNFDRITYIYFRDDEVMFEAFKGGAYDFRAENRAQRWKTQYDFPAVTQGHVLLDEVPIEAPRGYVGFVFNTRRPPLDDIKVREALSQLFDFEWTRKNIFYDEYTRARSYFPGSDYGVQDFPTPKGAELALLEPFRDQLPEEVFTTQFTPPVTDGSGRIREQLREAWRLFEEAGWVVRDGRLVDAETGEQMRLEILEDDQTFLRLLQPFVENLKRAGIDASIRVVDTAQMERRRQDYDYDMMYIAANFFPPPGPEMATWFASEVADQPDSGNWSGIKNPVVDALLEEFSKTRGHSEEDLEHLKVATRALDRVLLWNHYIIPSYYNDEAWIAYWNIFGRPEREPRYGIGFPGSWWYDTELAGLHAPRR